MLQLHKADGSADGAGPAIAIRREDYSAPAYWIDSVELTFDLDPNKTRVLNLMTLRRNPDVALQPLKLVRPMTAVERLQLMSCKTRAAVINYKAAISTCIRISVFGSAGAVQAAHITPSKKARPYASRLNYLNKPPCRKAIRI